MLVPPPLYALAAGITQVVVSPSRPAPVPRTAAAAALAAGSLAVAFGADLAFRRAETTTMPMDPSLTTALVTTGVNAHTRNPMYLGMAGLLTAHALRRGSVVALLPVAAFVAVIDRVQIAAEEKALAASFGEEYAAYRASVPRWVGRRSLHRSPGRSPGGPSGRSAGGPAGPSAG